MADHTFPVWDSEEEALAALLVYAEKSDDPLDFPRSHAVIQIRPGVYAIGRPVQLDRTQRS